MPPVRPICLTKAPRFARSRPLGLFPYITQRHWVPRCLRLDEAAQTDYISLYEPSKP